MEWDGMKSNLCQILQHRSPRAVKISPGGSQNRGWGRPREPRCIQKVPKTSPEGPKRRPRSIQERPRDVQETPARAQEAPNPFSNQAQQGRNASQTRSGVFREHVADLSSKKAFSEVSADEFRFVFSMIAKSVDLDFYRPCRGFRRFFKKACRSIDVSGMREKTSKNLRRSEIEPGALWSVKKAIGRGRIGWIAWING